MKIKAIEPTGSQIPSTPGSVTGYDNNNVINVSLCKETSTFFSTNKEESC